MFNNYLLLFVMKRLSNGINVVTGTGIFLIFPELTKIKETLKEKFAWFLLN